MKKLLPLLLLSCASSPWSQKYGYFPGGDINQYANAQPSEITPFGILYNDYNQHINVNTIDKVVNNLQQCLGYIIDRSKFVILFPTNWTLNCNKSQQILPIIGIGNSSNNNNSNCHEKELCGNNVTCHYRAVVAQPNVIVTTPSMYLLKDALTRFITGSTHPWSDPLVVNSECLTPDTGPLDLNGAYK
jgi:hypothetical protein